MPGNSVQTWQASNGTPGIDDLHSFASEPLVTDPPPLYIQDPRPETGPWYQFRVPDGQPGEPYYAQRRASEALATQYSDTETDGEKEPWSDMQHARDPRTVTVPVERWTGTTGPMQFFFLRPFGQRQEKRFDGSHYSAPTPLTRGMKTANEAGFTRFRTTQRVIPAPLDEQIGNTRDEYQRAAPVLQQGRSIRSWWRPIHSTH